MQEPLPKKTADRLEKRIRSNPGARLPSIAALAKEFNVAKETMSKAIRVLVSRGIVRSIRGKGIQVTEQLLKESGVKIEDQSSEKRLFSKIKAAIEDGTYQVGSSLPKQDFFLLSENVGYNTIGAAYKLLSNEKLIHKQGRRWIVGPIRKKESPHVFSRKSDAPAILIITPWEFSMHGFFTSVHTIPFITVLGTELLRFGFKQHHLAMNHRPIGSMDVESRLSETRALIRSLGSRYKGALVHHGFVFESQHFSDLDAWIPELCSFKKPVVFFDSTGTSHHVSRKRYGLRDTLFRPYFDEYGAIEAALQTLVSLGHRTIGAPRVPTRGDRWMRQRISRTEEIAARMKERPEIVTAEIIEEFWHRKIIKRSGPSSEFTERLARDIREQHGDISPNPCDLRDALFSHTPSLASLLGNGVTAVLAPGDYIAYEFYQWLLTAGFRIPKDISLVSFDNSPESATRPVATIDFGFGRLGYLAAHLLIDDIPIQTGRYGEIPGPVSLVDNGSIGQARKRHLRI